jgi:hypothetical protein
VQARDTSHLDPRSEFKFVTSHGRTNHHAHNASLYAMSGKRMLKYPAGFFDKRLVDFLIAA